MSPSLRLGSGLGSGLACLLLAACTPTDGGGWCREETEVAQLAQTPLGIPLLRARELRGPFEVELEWSATRHAFEANGGVHPTQAVFDGARTVATFSVEPRPGRAVFWQGEERGECDDNLLLVPVSLKLRTDDGRLDATWDGEAEFRDGERSVMGTVAGLPVPGLGLPHCDPERTSAGFWFEEGEFRPRLTVTCKADATEPREHERLAIPREMYVIGTWFRLADPTPPESTKTAR